MSALYEPTNTPRAKALLRRARTTNRRRDSDEHKAGFANPHECDFATWLRNIISALVCALETGDVHALAEGVAMLQDAEASIRPKPQEKQA